MGLHGSPSDYAWGPQGLENIITQMLANLEDDGPPPTDKEKMDALPTVEVTAEELRECELGIVLGVSAANKFRAWKLRHLIAPTLFTVSTVST